ncbi:hypothetical protein [Nostoc sp. NMS8]|uniref:hypothetical protein n=1 Tax=Nostoc sp. NMS8 TaxID=2815392 RepID=UPI0025FF854B|nr:hypothetical protein [Nostoc sp. NMS8]MBN3960948.1 hypothetical protein [Nostoc sp. NMS8]
MIFIYISSNVTIAVLFIIAILVKKQKKRELLTQSIPIQLFCVDYEVSSIHFWRMLRTIVECIYLT